jgi:peptide subunit release factor 1 (eRF1)
MFINDLLPPPSQIRWISRKKLIAYFDFAKEDENIKKINIIPSAKLKQFEEINSLAEINSKTIVISYESFSIFIALPFPYNLDLTFYKIEDIKSILTNNISVGIAFLELGSYVLGLVKFNKILFSKRGSRYVKGRHKAGGQSQRRFERNREKWIDELYKKISLDINEHLYPLKQNMDHFVLFGDTNILSDFLSESKIGKQFQNKLITKKTSLKNFNAKTLITASTTIWSSRIYIDDKNAIVEKIY